MNSDNNTNSRQQTAQALEAEFFLAPIAHDKDHAHEMHFLIAKHINRVRKEKGLSMKAFAKKIGVDKAQLLRWLTGRRNLTVRSIARMQVALEEPVVMVAGQPKYLSYQERGLRSAPSNWTHAVTSDRTLIVTPEHQEGVTVVSWEGEVMRTPVPVIQEEGQRSKVLEEVLHNMAA